MSEIDQLRYPIGKFAPKSEYTREEQAQLISTIETFPERLITVVKDFSQQQFDTPYRDGGWTVRQLIHHLADSHMHSYVRFKWTLTEDKPTIKAYDEKLWAETSETQASPDLSTAFLRVLHAKWCTLLKNLSATDVQRSYIHPESKKEVTLERMLALYAWHGEHHLAHITSLVKRMNW